MKKILAVLMTLAAAAWAQTGPPAGSGSGTTVDIEARLYLDRESARQALGADPGPNVVIVHVKLTPKGEEKMRLDHDEFLLRSDRDGQSARPLHPAQIAGSSVMVITSRGGQQGTAMQEQRRRPYGVPGVGGIPGRPEGAPPSLPDPQGSVGGAATANTSEAHASIEEQKVSQEQKALLDVMKEKILPEGEIDGPVSGLLYFSFEGKQRPRQMELVYRRVPPRVSVRFIEPKKK